MNVLTHPTFFIVSTHAGILLRYGLIAVKSKDWLDKQFMPWFGPCALLGLLYTIVIMFASQDILTQIGNVARVAVPMLVYFTVMFFASFALSYWCKMSYEFSVTQVGCWWLHSFFFLLTT
jgi:ACR3 family arsenite transporter